MPDYAAILARAKEGDEGRYRDRLRAFVRPADWDEDGDVRTVAISCLGGLIAKDGTGIGLDDLLRIAGDPNDQQSDWAIRALAVAVGEKAESLPTVRKGMRSRPELVERVLIKAEGWRKQGEPTPPGDSSTASPG